MRYPKSDDVGEFSLFRVHGFNDRDGDITSVELLLPCGPETAELLKKRKLDAEAARDAYLYSDAEAAVTPVHAASIETGLQEFTEDVNSEDRDRWQVPCINEEDVVVEQKAAIANSKLSERDRTNGMKALTKRLLERPMTRRIGVPKDVHAAMERLTEMAPHIPALVDALRTPLLVAATTRAPPVFPPILLVGPAGVGKSHVALQLAEVLGVSAHTVSYAASGAHGSWLTGADKSWGNAQTGLVFSILAEGEFGNPVICLDEIDKASSSTTMSGVDRHPLNELLALLEPATAKDHRDRCAEIRVDARHIVWVATANSLQGLSAPLLSRFKLILVGKPDARSSVTIALSVAAAASAQLGRALDAPRGEVLQLLATMTPRVMRRIFSAAAGLAISNGRSVVTMNDMERALGMPVQGAAQLH